MVESSGPGSSGSDDLESTAALLAQVRDGDPAARDRLIRRYLPLLKRWARGRLPYSARDLADTDDLVQVTLLRALDKVSGFEPRREGAFLAYLRRILMNQIRDHIRSAQRKPRLETLTASLPEGRPSPLDETIGSETMAVYEAALKQLPEKQQEAVILRVELGFTHQEVAAALDIPSANAARMTVARALVRLAEVLDER